MLFLLHEDANQKVAFGTPEINCFSLTDTILNRGAGGSTEALSRFYLFISNTHLWFCGMSNGSSLHLKVYYLCSMLKGRARGVSACERCLIRIKRLTKQSGEFVWKQPFTGH